MSRTLAIFLWLIILTFLSFIVVGAVRLEHSIRQMMAWEQIAADLQTAWSGK